VKRTQRDEASLRSQHVCIRVEGLLAEVVLATGDGHVIAIITANAVRELRLKKGDTAAALIKSTDVRSSG
jgi:molybdopterin-binding protein